jgi:hypothetical protein
MGRFSIKIRKLRLSVLVFLGYVTRSNYYGAQDFALTLKHQKDD